MLKIITANSVFLLLFFVSCAGQNTNIKGLSMTNKTKINIEKMCSNNIYGNIYKFEIRDNILKYWKNNKEILVHDESLDPTTSQYVVSYIYKTDQSKLYPELVNDNEIGNTIFSQEIFTDNSKTYTTLYINDASNYKESTEIYLVQLSNKWVGHIVVWEYEGSEGLEKLKVTSPIEFKNCKNNRRKQ